MDLLDPIWRDLPQLKPEQPCASSTPPKRKCYSFALKLEILNFAKKTSVRKASQTFGVDRSCIRDWKKQEDKLLLASQNHKGLFKYRYTGTGKDKIGSINRPEKSEARDLFDHSSEKAQEAPELSHDKNHDRTSRLGTSLEKMHSLPVEQKLEGYILHKV